MRLTLALVSQNAYRAHPVVSTTSTASRSIVGVMNEFTHLAGVWHSPTGTDDLDELSLRLAQVPCSPLYKSHISPDRELAALIADAHA